MSRPPSLFQPAGGKPHQLRMNGKIPIGISHMSMTQKGRQHGQTPFNVFAGSIPLNQSVEGKSVPEIVNPRAGVVGRSAQADLTRQIVKGSADRGGFQTTAMIVEQKAG